MLGDQPFNTNLGKVLYELRAAGQLNLNNSVLRNARNSVWPHGSIYTICLISYKAHFGLDIVNDLSSTVITDRLIDRISQ